MASITKTEHGYRAQIYMRLPGRDKPVRDSKSFRTRREAARAVLEGFTWHDTRHTAATMISKKVDVLDLCKIFGWSDPKMAMVYYNPHAETLADLLD